MSCSLTGLVPELYFVSFGVPIHIVLIDQINLVVAYMIHIMSNLMIREK